MEVVGVVIGGLGQRDAFLVVAEPARDVRELDPGPCASERLVWVFVRPLHHPSRERLGLRKLPASQQEVLEPQRELEQPIRVLGFSFLGQLYGFPHQLLRLGVVGGIAAVAQDVAELHHRGD